MRYLIVPLARLAELHSHPINVVVICSERSPGESSFEIQRLIEIFASSNIKISFIPILNSVIEQKIDMSKSRLPHAAYLRLWIPTVLEFESYILYLDLDIWLERSIDYLLTLKPTKAIAAHYMFGSINSFRLYGDHNRSYFANGTMVMNVQRLLELRFFENVTAEINTNPHMTFLEMDAMNLFLGNNQEVENLNENFCWLIDYPRPKFEFSREGFSYHSIAIVHFNGPAKPWSSKSYNIYHLKWRKTYRRFDQNLSFSAIDLLSERNLRSHRITDKIYRWIAFNIVSKFLTRLSKVYHKSQLK